MAMEKKALNVSPKIPLLILRIEWVLLLISFIVFIGTLILTGVMSQRIIATIAIDACDECNEENKDNWDKLIDQDLAKYLFVLSISVTFIVGSVMLAIHSLLNILLRNAIREVNPKKFQTWMIIHGILLILSILCSLSSIVKGNTTGILIGLGPILAWIYRGVSIYMIYNFTNELIESQSQSQYYVPEDISNGGETTMTEIPL